MFGHGFGITPTGFGVGIGAVAVGCGATWVGTGVGGTCVGTGVGGTCVGTGVGGMVGCGAVGGVMLRYVLNAHPVRPLYDTEWNPFDCCPVRTTVAPAGITVTTEYDVADPERMFSVSVTR